MTTTTTIVDYNQILISVRAFWARLSLCVQKPITRIYPDDICRSRLSIFSHVLPVEMHALWLFLSLALPFHWHCSGRRWRWLGDVNGGIGTFFLSFSFL